jgi:hypothetical protein
MFEIEKCEELLEKKFEIDSGKNMKYNFFIKQKEQNSSVITLKLQEQQFQFSNFGFSKNGSNV